MSSFNFDYFYFETRFGFGVSRAKKLSFARHNCRGTKFCSCFVFLPPFSNDNMTAVMNPSKHTLTVNHVLQRCRLNDPGHVRRMNVCGSSLEDISAMRHFGNVEVCSFSANDISDLDSLRGCSRMTELHLRKNRIAHFDQVLHLSHLPLRVIGLSENPIAAHPEYRKFVIAALPQLVKLDDIEVSAGERRAAESEIRDPFAAARNLRVDAEALLTPIPGRPGSSSAVYRRNDCADVVAGASSSSSGGSPDDKQHQQQQQERSPLQKKREMLREARERAAAATAGGSSTDESYEAGFSSKKSNRYNGDDVPIGGGPVAMAAAPRPASAGGNSNTNNMNAASKIKRDPFASADVMQPGDSIKSSSIKQDPVDSFYTQDSGAAGNAARRERFMSHSRPPPPARASNSGSDTEASGPAAEQASIQAVKILLSAMSPAAVAEIKRHLSLSQ